ncbi:hypothetical protein E2I00_004534, partial [Balaenoptera physalus]
SAQSTNAAPDGCPTPAGEVDMRLAGAALLRALGKVHTNRNNSLYPQAQRTQARPMGHPCCPYPEPRARKYKCGLPQPCPEEHLAFRMVSGAANVIGPKICLEDRIGELIEARAFDMWAGDVNDLLKFIRPLHEGTLVFVASYDDPATKMNEETRKLFSDLGSKNVKDLAFRDSWVFVGAKGVQNKSPFEQHVKNSKHTNKYEGWPEALEMEGCIPRRTTAS